MAKLKWRVSHEQVNGGASCKMRYWVRGVCSMAKVQNMEANCSASTSPRSCKKVREGVECNGG